MNLPGNRELLEIWEYGLQMSPLHRSINLILNFFPSINSEAALNMSIGERDRHLILIRHYLFGKTLECCVDCPGCGEKIEWNSTTDDFLKLASNNEKSASYKLEADEGTLEFRLPNTQDLLISMNQPEPETAIILRCLHSLNEESVSSTDISSFEKISQQTLKKLDEAFDRFDPLANIKISLDCPACQYHWQTVFDVVSYLWKELTDWCNTLLLSVTRLASAYGWREKDILNMSHFRRELYLGALG